MNKWNDNMAAFLLDLKLLTSTQSLLSCITAAAVTFEICSNFKFSLIFLVIIFVIIFSK